MPCAATVAMFGGFLTLAAQGTTVIGTADDFPPFSFRDEIGTHVGIDRDIGDEVCRRAQLTCEWAYAPFVELVPGVEAGRFDMAISGIASTAERMDHVAFTPDYLISSQTEHEDPFIGRASAPPPELAMIGIQAGTIHEGFVKERKWNYRAVTSVDALIEGLEAGEFDLIFGSFDCDQSVRELFDRGYVEAMRVTVGADGPAIAVCKEDQKLLADVTAALDAMAFDGTLSKIIRKWNGI